MVDRGRGKGVSRWLLLALALASTLALLEGGARTLEALRGGAGTTRGEAVRIDDERLEYRVEPGSGGHDARGFRNRQALARADVVALGDSQTWGVNAAIDETWPAILARKSGLSVYNMGHGGYGPLHYRELAPSALALSPRVLLVALYFGNDLFDAYDLAYRFDAHAERRHPDAAERARIAAAPYPELKPMFFARLRYRRPGFSPFVWLTEQTAAGRLAAVAFGGVDPRFDQEWAEDHPDEGFVYRDGAIETVFHTTYRLAAVDLRLAQVQEGVRITEASLAAIHQVVEKTPGTALVVVLLPTKERIFARPVRERGIATPPSYAESVAFEEAIAARLTAWMDANGIAWVDTHGALEARVLAGEAIFPPNGDGHFTPEGYAVVAEAAADIVARTLAGAGPSG